MLQPRSATLPTLLLLFGLGCGHQNDHADADVGVKGEIAAESTAKLAEADVPADAPADVPTDVPADTLDARLPDLQIWTSCATDADCPVAFPTCEHNTCVSGCPIACPTWEPVCVDGQCRECQNSSQCPCGTCGADGRCWFGYGSCACVEPYGACITVYGQVMCVECVSDGDCPLGCGCGADHACIEPDGDVCPRLSAGCTHDCVTAGCPDPEHVWSTLVCDPAAGCCASPDARCDDRMAFCTQAGSLCLPLRDIFGITAAVSLDGVAACSGFAAGYCTCDPTTQVTCATTPRGTIGGCCPVGQACLPGDELFRRLVGDPTATPPLDASGWAFCAPDDARLSRVLSVAIPATRGQGRACVASTNTSGAASRTAFTSTVAHSSACAASSSETGMSVP